jgi:hypothetical protein
MFSRKSSAILLSALISVAAFPARGQAQDADVVIEWNRLAQTAIAAPGALPPTVFFTHPYALVHVAIFDAMNSIDRTYTPIGVEVDASPSASRGAAAAQAAHDVLAALMPTQQAVFASALSASLARFPGEPGREGARVGSAVARRWLELRANDGWNRPAPDYLLPSLPGYYQVTPPQNGRAVLTHYPDVQPYVVGSGRQFLVAPAPVLTSEHYAADLNEAKILGSATSTVRTPEQTQLAQMWSGVATSTPLHVHWHNIARDVTQSRGTSGIETARLFALMSISVHDGLLTIFTGKYLYGLWRPVTAIRGAADDGNPATDADPAWLPLIPTPAYPAYPGGLACLGAASSRVMTRYFGRDDIAITATWTLTNGTTVTRRFNGFREAADEQARARIYAGIHFTFDNLSSIGTCGPLADYVFENTARPRFQSR